MAHFAEIKDGIVQRVIVAEQDFIDTGAVGDPDNWVQTSYNANFRGTFAGGGFSYDEAKDLFITPQPFDSWTLNVGQWEPPVPRPADGMNYLWDEGTLSWKNIEIQ